MEMDVMGMDRNIPLRTNQRRDRGGCAKSTHECPRGVQVFTAPLVIPIGRIQPGRSVQSRGGSGRDCNAMSITSSEWLMKGAVAKI